MTAQMIPDSANYQQTLNQIVETLPLERIRQIVDFARFLQAQTLENPLPLAADDSMPELQGKDPLDQEVQFFEAQHNELVKEYLGQYIAMLNGQVIASHAELDTLISNVRESHPESTVLYRQVAESLPPTIVFRSPRLEQV